MAVEPRINSETSEKQKKLYSWFPHCPRYCLECVIQVTWLSCSVFSCAMGGTVGTAESKSAGAQGCCWDHPQAQSLLPAQVGAGRLLMGAWVPRGLSVQQQQWRQAAPRGWAGDAITPARTKSFTGSSVLCSLCLWGALRRQVLDRLISLPEPMAHPRDLPPAAGLSALLPAAMGPCLQLTQPTSPQLPISEKLL